MNSLLDQDLYQFNVAQIVLRRFANVHVQYEFKCRNADKIQFFKYFGSQDFDDLCKYLEDIQLIEAEYEYLKSKPYFHEDFLDWLRCFRFEPRRHLQFKTVDYKEGVAPIVRQWTLNIEGSWLHTLFYEIFVLAFINERFARNYIRATTELTFSEHQEEGQKRLEDKIVAVAQYGKLPLIEFGTRRRFSCHWQGWVIQQLLDQVPNSLIGTSNVMFANKFGLKEIGTFSHQLPMVMQALYPIQHSQRQAFRIWMEEYRGQWGIALSDTLGDDKFFKDFTLDFAKAYDGVRHDSGDPFAYGERIIKMYQGYGIDPAQKRIVFSDSLDIPKAIALHKHFGGRIQTSFGIGTNLTNDMGLPVPQIVIKPIAANGQPVIKLSADPGKTMCHDPIFKEYALHAINHY